MLWGGSEGVWGQGERPGPTNSGVANSFASDLKPCQYREFFLKGSHVTKSLHPARVETQGYVYKVRWKRTDNPELVWNQPKE